MSAFYPLRVVCPQGAGHDGNWPPALVWPVFDEHQRGACQRPLSRPLAPWRAVAHVQVMACGVVQTHRACAPWCPRPAAQGRAPHETVFISISHSTRQLRCHSFAWRRPWKCWSPEAAGPRTACRFISQPGASMPARGPCSASPTQKNIREL